MGGDACVGASVDGIRFVALGSWLVGWAWMDGVDDQMFKAGGYGRRLRVGEDGIRCGSWFCSASSLLVFVSSRLVALCMGYGYGN